MPRAARLSLGFRSTWRSKALWDRAFSLVDCPTRLVLRYGTLGFFDARCIIRVTVDFGIFTKSAIFECDFPVLCNASTTEIVSSECSLLAVLGFEGMMIIGCEFVKWQEDEITVKLVGASLNADRCITSCTRLYMGDAGYMGAQYQAKLGTIRVPSHFFYHKTVIISAPFDKIHQPDRWCRRENGCWCIDLVIRAKLMRSIN